MARILASLGKSAGSVNIYQAAGNAIVAGAMTGLIALGFYLARLALEQTFPLPALLLMVGIASAAAIGIAFIGHTLAQHGELKTAPARYRVLPKVGPTRRKKMTARR